jgi:hypothetical protein
LLSLTATTPHTQEAKKGMLRLKFHNGHFFGSTTAMTAHT